MARRTGAEYAWLLPSALLGDDGDGDRDDGDGDRDGRPRPRTPRDWAVDLCCFLFAAGLGLLTAKDLPHNPYLSDTQAAVDQLLGALGCAALWLRRRWPVGLAAVLVPASLVSSTLAGALAVALFTVAVHRPFRQVAAIGVPAVAAAPLSALLIPEKELGFGALTLLGLVIYLAVTGWGMFVRARRRLVIALRDRARRAESEARLRAAEAQRLAREAIAREMHDVLAHRLSLLSLHAGALEFHPDAPPEEVGRAAGVIRDSAHRALEDLREVIGVLRAAGPEDGDRPRPTLADLPRLVAESRAAGARVTLDDRLGERSSVPEAVGRTAYRIVQEGLTNARKHARGAHVTVTLAGAPGEGLTVEVRNPVPGGGPGEIPGAGQGLIGLAERAALAGGRLEHGLTGGGDHRLRAWLPWPA
ncbi:sensor histidine kinase [Streptomyces sp. URMC 123]|uniref:sensor histidine kinase n=1 Tax=Streptomyces sp. URMC 123 TaxID=3423403 RepID=UPI003F1A172D